MDIMALYKAMQGDGKADSPVTFYRAYKFSSVVGQNAITAAYKNIGVEGNVLFIQSDFPVDLIIGEGSREILNVKRHMFTTDINAIQIRKSPTIFNDAINSTNAVADANLAGRCRIWGFNAPYSIQQIIGKIEPPTNNFHIDGTVAALDTSHDEIVSLQDRAVSQVTIHTLTIERATANVTDIRIIDADTGAWQYYFRKPAPFLLFSERIYPVHLPTRFLIRLETISDAGVTDLDIDITYESK